jgi:hypothetical protein
MSESKEQAERDQQRNEHQSPEPSEDSSQGEPRQCSSPTDDGSNQGEQDHDSSSDAADSSNDTHSTTDGASGSVETRRKDDWDAVEDEASQALQSLFEYVASNHGAGTAPLPDDVQSKVDYLFSDEFQSKLGRLILADDIGDNIRLMVHEKFGNTESGAYGIGSFSKRVGIGRNRAGAIFRGKSKEILNLKVSELADCSYALGVTPAVLIGELSEDEQETIYALRDLDERDRAAVQRIIDSLSRRGHDAASDTGTKISSEDGGL